MSERGRWRGTDGELDGGFAERSDRPAPGKVASTSLIGNANIPRTSVAQLRKPDKPGEPWKAVVTIDEGLHSSDVKHVAGHELDEAVEIVRRADKDPSVDIATEQKAGVMRPGASAGTKSTAHDVAAVRELESLFVKARKALDDFAAAKKAEKKGTTIPKAVADEHEKQNGRLERMLDAMGFGEDASFKERLDLLDKNLEPGMALKIKLHIASTASAASQKASSSATWAGSSRRFRAPTRWARATVC